MFTRTSIAIIRSLALAIGLFAASGSLLGSADQSDADCEVKTIPGKAHADTFVFGDIVIGETKLSFLEKKYDGFNNKYLNIGRHVKQYCVIDTSKEPDIVAVFSGNFYDGFNTLASLEIIAGEPEDDHQLNCKNIVNLPIKNRMGVAIGMSDKELLSNGPRNLKKNGNRYCLKQYYSENGIYYHNNMIVTLKDQKVTSIFVQNFGEPE